MHEHDGKVALVTGANKGIGRAVAAQLAARGAAGLLGARDLRRGEEAAAAIRDTGGDAHAVLLDVTDPATARRAAEHVRGRFGRLDILVNNAGITGSGPVSPQDAHDQVPSTVDLDMVRAVFETNVFGVITVTNAMVPLLRRSATPRIVNVASHAASLTLTSDPTSPFGALMPSAAYSPVEDRADRADRAVRQRAPRGRHPRQRRRTGLRRDGQQQPQRVPHRRRGRRRHRPAGNAHR